MQHICVNLLSVSDFCVSDFHWLDRSLGDYCMCLHCVHVHNCSGRTFAYQSLFYKESTGGGLTPRGSQIFMTGFIVLGGELMHTECDAYRV